MNSIVYTGRLCNNTQKCIDITRSWFKDEIVVVTWKSEYQKLTNIDKYVEIDDPGPGPIQNVYRQVYSTKIATELASGELVLRSRADIAFYKNPFSCIDDTLINNNELTIFKNRIIIGSVGTFNSSNTINSRLFSPSDFWFCGDRLDLLKLSSITLDDMAKYSNNSQCSEQIWFLTLINKYNEKKFTIDQTYENTNASYLSLVNNFQVINSYEDAGVAWLKHDGAGLDWPEKDDHFFYKERWVAKYKEIYGTL